MQTVSGRVRVRVVPLGGVYTFAPAHPSTEIRSVRDEPASTRGPRHDGHVLRRIEPKRASGGA